MAQIPDGPTLTNENTKIWSGGSQQNEYKGEMEFIWSLYGVNTKIVFGLPNAKQIG